MVHLSDIVYRGTTAVIIGVQYRTLSLYLDGIIARDRVYYERLEDPSP